MPPKNVFKFMDNKTLYATVFLATSFGSFFAVRSQQGKSQNENNVTKIPVVDKLEEKIESKLHDKLAEEIIEKIIRD